MRIFLLLVALVILTSTAMILGSPAKTWADSATAGAATNPGQAQQEPAGSFVQTLGNQAIAVMADKSLTTEQRSQRYRGILRDSFDLQTIGRFVLGRAWSSATPEQQKNFMELFERMVLETYGDHLNFYSGEKFQVKNIRQESDKDNVVSSEVLHTDGTPPTSIDWRVRQENGKLAVIDVVIEGVSQSVTQRQEYASILQRSNGNIDALLDLMKQKTQGSQQ
jgi:phospholipid transport system substrate-binding protein